MQSKIFLTGIRLNSGTLLYFRRGGSLAIGSRLSSSKRGSIPTTGSGEDSATQDESLDGEEQAN